MSAIEKVGNVSVDYDAVLKALNLNQRDPKTQALLIVCDRYGLDPLLKHLVLIQGNPYITRDGYLAVAHRSGQFDGMEVMEQTEDNSHYIAKVAVYRRDMRHPFTFVGRFPKNKNMAKEYGPEMAVKVAEVQALRRAFNVTGVGAADERWDDAVSDRVTAVPENVDGETGEVLQLTVKRPAPVVDTDDEPVEAEVVGTIVDRAEQIQPQSKAVASLLRGLESQAQAKGLNLAALVEETLDKKLDAVTVKDGPAITKAVADA